MMRSVEADNRNVRHHALAQGADLLVETECPCASEGGSEGPGER
jgi:hypothetical protein